MTKRPIKKNPSKKPSGKKRSSGKCPINIKLPKLPALKLPNIKLDRNTLIIFGAAAILLVIILLAIFLPKSGNTPQAIPSDTTALTVNDSSPAGTILLNPNAAIEITYNAAEQVLTMYGSDARGEALVTAQGNMVGKDITEVVKTLVQSSIDSGYLTEGNVIVIRQIQPVSAPESFLQNIMVDIQSVSQNYPIISLFRGDVSDVGYITLDKAKEILIAAMALDEETLIEGNPEPEMQRYVLSYTIDEVVHYYTVDANNGSVGEANPADYDENIVLGVDPEGTMYDPDNAEIDDTENVVENPEDTPAQNTLETEDAVDEGFIEEDI